MTRWMRLLRWFGLARQLPRSGVRIVMLDPDTSQFVTMLMNLPTVPGHIFRYWNEDLWGSWVWVG